MTDTSTSAPLLTREALSLTIRSINDLMAAGQLQDVPTLANGIIASHKAQADRIEAQETEIERLREALLGMVQAFYTAHFDADLTAWLIEDYPPAELVVAEALLGQYGVRLPFDAPERAALAAVDTQEEAGDA